LANITGLAEIIKLLTVQIIILRAACGYSLCIAVAFVVTG
jgi:hypothetical protein